MSEDVKCSQYDVKQNKKLSDVFPLQASGRCQSIKEVSKFVYIVLLHISNDTPHS